VCTRYSAWHIAWLDWPGYIHYGVVADIARVSVGQSRRYNITPTSLMPVADMSEARLASFGVRPAGERLICNARDDQLAGYWRRFRTRRCVVPANGFFEFAADKQPWYFTHRELPVFCFAGLELDNGFVVVTTRPTADVADIHDRMPVLLEPSALADWLGDARLPGPLPAGRLTRQAVTRRVNSVHSEGPELLEPDVGLFG
jgi:putative SOS response-associated peptidase YedK